MILLLRVFAPASSPDAVIDTGGQLLQALARFAPVPTEPPQQYWKVPEWYEYTFGLSPANESAFDAVLALGADGWSHVVRDGECSAVWNPGKGPHLLLEEVTWAEVLLNHPAAPAGP
jgi:hypothetical protein